MMLPHPHNVNEVGGRWLISDLFMLSYSVGLGAAILRIAHLFSIPRPKYSLSYGTNAFLTSEERPASQQRPMGLSPMLVVVRRFTVLVGATSNLEWRLDTIP